MSIQIFHVSTTTEYVLSSLSSLFLDIFRIYHIVYSYHRSSPFSYIRHIPIQSPGPGLLKTSVLAQKSGGLCQRRSEESPRGPDEGPTRDAAAEGGGARSDGVAAPWEVVGELG